MRRLGAPLATLMVSGCAVGPPACPEVAAGSVYLIDQGWHVELGVPVEDLTGPLAGFARRFPGARSVMFGYGKRTFVTAPGRSLSEFILGPVPGPAVIEVFALNTLPPAAYPAAPMVALPPPPGGVSGLSDYIWDDFAKDAEGGPRLVADGGFPGSAFYAARSRYSLAHTCNTWVAGALGAAGIPVSTDGVVFSDQLMGRGRKAATDGCGGRWSQQGGAVPLAQTAVLP